MASSLYKKSSLSGKRFLIANTILYPAAVYGFNFGCVAHLYFLMFYSAFTIAKIKAKIADDNTCKGKRIELFVTFDVPTQ